MSVSAFRHVSRRDFALPSFGRLSPAFLSVAFVLPVAAVHGGYFPTSWGWTGVGVSTLAVIGVVVIERLRVSRAEWLVIGSAVALLGWTVVSVTWASQADAGLNEAARLVVYISVLLAVFVFTTRASWSRLAVGLWIAIAGVTVFALATRLFPGWHSTFDSFAGYRLAEPIGYWNGLGVLAALGVIMGVGVALRAERPLMGALVAAPLPIAVVTLYFTFSRGAWLALGFGLCTAAACESCRLWFITGAALILVPSIAAVALASHLTALTHKFAAGAAARHDGHRLAVALVVLAAGSSAFAFVVCFVAGRVKLTSRQQHVYAAALVLAGVSIIAAGVASAGGPRTLAHKTYESLNATESRSADLNRRLFSLASPGRIDHWRVAVREYSAHPFFGSGAGTYEQYWMKDRRYGFNVRNAHSLYLETLATVGPVGLALLLASLGPPLFAAWKARRQPLVPAVAGAYVAFLAHAGIDWDWQLPAVTLAALICGAALLIAARNEEKLRPLTMRVRAPLALATLVLFVFAFIGLRGNLALAASGQAIAARDYAKAEAEAKDARTWAPWSSAPWQKLGEAQLYSGDYAAARHSFRRAIAKDSKNWYLWFDLAGASSGNARKQALTVALRLNPLSPEIASSLPQLTREIKGKMRASH